MNSYFPAFYRSTYFLQPVVFNVCLMNGVFMFYFEKSSPPNIQQDMSVSKKLIAATQLYQ